MGDTPAQAARIVPRTAEQKLALAVVTTAMALAARLRQFHTAEGMLATEDISSEPLYLAIEALADQHYGGQDKTDALQLSAFAIGVAWGRLDGKGGV
jgi:hypothetical protein